MPTYEVHIGELIDDLPPSLRPNESTPVVRSVFWGGDVADEAAARAAAYDAWGVKYGDQPAQALVKVSVVES